MDLGVFGWFWFALALDKVVLVGLVVRGWFQFLFPLVLNFDCFLYGSLLVFFLLACCKCPGRSVLWFA